MNNLFSHNIDINKNAYLNWRTDETDQAYNMYVIAKGFSNAAKQLITDVLSDNRDKKADSLIFPILYSVDQSIELYIKAILRQIDILNGEKPSNYKTHDIKKLVDSLRGAVNKIENNSGKLETHIKPITDYIAELYSRISDQRGVNIDFARYPIDTSGDAHFYITEKDNIVIDVENLKHWFDKIDDILSGLFLMY